MALRYSLRQLEYFVAVGDEGSIVKASRKVNVSSPSISAAITQLEEEFGLPLFVRKHAHGLTLTQPGQQFLLQARRVLHEAAGMNRLADELSGKVQGLLTVGCLLTFAQLIVPSLRRSFEQQFPRVQVSQRELDQLAIFEQLRCAQIDVALTYDLDIPRDIDFIPIKELLPFVIVSVSHSLASHNSVTLATLCQFDMVLLDLPHSAEYFMSLFDAQGVCPTIAERTRDVAVMRSLVANDFGYSIANIRPANNNAPDGRPLRFLSFSESVKSLNLGIALINDSAKALTVQSFLEHCQQCIPESSLFTHSP